MDPIKMWRDKHRHIAAEVDVNPRYRRWLMVAGNGVDIVKMTEADVAKAEWQAVDLERGALRFALCFARSTLPKSARAWNVMKEIIQMELQGMSMADLVAQYNKLTGRTIKKFETKAAAIKAITKVSTPQNVVAAEPLAQATSGNGAMMQTATQLLENGMTTKAKTKRKSAVKKETKPTRPAKSAKKSAAAPKKRGKPDAAKIERAKKIANTKNGAGGVIVALLKAGKLDVDAILSQAIKKFPEQSTKLSHVYWYRSMLKAAGVLK